MSMTLWAPLGSILGRTPENTAPRLRRARRLYRESIWHPMLSRLLQLGILAAIVALWQIGVEVGFIDGFFWSYPSQIFKTAQVFVAQGDGIARHLVHSQGERSSALCSAPAAAR